jgi:hypothetical protein
VRRRPEHVFALDHDASAYLRDLSDRSRVPASAIVRELVSMETLADWARGRGLGESNRLCVANGEADLGADE